VSAPAVPRMLKRLKSAGYVKHIPYQGVELSERGLVEALKEVRRHRILEVFLVEIMGFGWDETHEHADELGKGLNDAVTERMAEMTHFPTRCPHGEPIPDAKGQLPVVEDTCIRNVGIGYKGVVSRVRTNEPEKLRYFATLGLVPGQTFEIIGRAPFNGPVRLLVGDEEVVLGTGLTESLWVSPQS
jgi:DtxR family transcriptional regulator, Mn-dependent transcriptional regulator